MKPHVSNKHRQYSVLFGIKMSEHTILDCYVVGNHVCVRVRVFVSVFQYSVSII